MHGPPCPVALLYTFSFTPALAFRRLHIVGNTHMEGSYSHQPFSPRVCSGWPFSFPVVGVLEPSTPPLHANIVRQPVGSGDGPRAPRSAFSFRAVSLFPSYFFRGCCARLRSFHQSTSRIGPRISDGPTPFHLHSFFLRTYLLMVCVSS